MREAVAEFQAGNRLAVEVNSSPSVGESSRAEDGEEGGLTAAGRAGDGEVFALFDFEIDRVQGVGFEFVGQKDFWLRPCMLMERSRW